MQTNRWLHLSSSLLGISLGKFPLLWHVQKKNRPEKFPFIETNSRIVIVVQRFVKYFFALNSRYSVKYRQKKKKLSIPKRFAVQASTARGR